MKLSRAKFEQLVDDLVERSLEPCRRRLKDAGYSASDIDEVVLVGGTTRIPWCRRRCQELFGKEPNKTVNPDEVVAVGAAVQGGVLAGDVKDVLLLDVTPLSLGHRDPGRRDDQADREEHHHPHQAQPGLLDGGRQPAPGGDPRAAGRARDGGGNRTIGRFILDGIPPAPRGVPQIEVTFDIDANGILAVKAKDKATGKEQSIRIEGSGGLENDEIDRMVREAEAHAARTRSGARRSRSATTSTR